MKAVLALIFGILGLVLIWVPVVGLVLAVLAIVFWSLQRKNPKGIATVGLVLAIIAIVFQTLIVVGALAMFGVFEPARLMPDRCSMPASMPCLDYTYDGSNVVLQLQNKMGQTIVFKSVELIGVDGQVCSVDSSDVIEDQVSAMFVINCPFEQDIGRFDVVVKYNNQGSDMEKTIAGDLMLRK